MLRARLARWWLGAAAVLGVAGCSLAPKNFRDMLAPAPIVRARAVNLGEDQPEWVAVPALIDRLSDPDQVVRMTANDALRKRTRRDFEFVPWGTVEERQPAVERWRAWWQERAAQAAYPKDDQLRKVSARPAPTGRKRRRRQGQGGPSRWPDTPQSLPQPSTDPTLAPATLPPSVTGSGTGSG